MKRLFLGLSVLISLFSCKEKVTPAPAEPQRRAQNCITLEEYDTLTKLEQKVLWLKQKGKDVCQPILDSAIIKSHTISPNAFSTTSKVPFTISSKEIKDFIGSNYYNAYVSFDFDSHGEIENIKMVSKFDTITTCFSVPFFRCIIKKNGLTDMDVLQFKKAMIKGKEKIVVIIEKNNVSYDYSNEPKSLKSTYNPL